MRPTVKICDAQFSSDYRDVPCYVVLLQQTKQGWQVRLRELHYSFKIINFLDNFWLIMRYVHTQYNKTYYSYPHVKKLASCSVCKCQPWKPVTGVMGHYIRRRHYSNASYWMVVGRARPTKRPCKKNCAHRTLSLIIELWRADRKNNFFWGGTTKYFRLQYKNSTSLLIHLITYLI